LYFSIGIYNCENLKKYYIPVQEGEMSKGNLVDSGIEWFYIKDLPNSYIIKEASFRAIDITATNGFL
jgi:hypothetical protein